MATQFASAKKALGVCDVCGFTYKLRELKNLVVKNRVTSTKACSECWNPDQPQLQLGKYPINDPQALRDPRPDFNQYASSRAQIVPVYSSSITGITVAFGHVGVVTVTTS
jgi:hypothetical protein